MDAFCILFANSFNNRRISELTNVRTFASTPFGGRYRLVDFMLSSLVNASVHDIGIVTNNKYGSLMDHVGWGKDWDLNRKNGGLKFLTPFSEDITYNPNRFQALRSVQGYIERMLQEYCILADSNIVANVDFEDMLKCHLENNADVTVLYSHAKPMKDDLEIQCDSSGRITDVLLQTDETDEKKDIIVNVCFLKKSLLSEMIVKGATYDWTDINRDFIAKNLNTLKIYGYRLNGYNAVIRNVDQYYSANMDLLNGDIRRELFKSGPKILTRIKDSVPTFYGDNNYVANSFVADGCRIDGYVENSIIFRDVKVESGAVIKNSIIMQGSVIESNTSISCVIADKNVRITSGRVLAGSENNPVIIAKGKVV